jgi:D-alanine-D-alanine ligase
MNRPGLTVIVIGGGQNCEHEVSLSSATSVATALRAAGHNVIELTIERDGSWRRGASPVNFAAAVEVLEDADVVFPVLHGPRGEDGTIAALCTLAGVPFVGSGLAPSAIGMDKWATKLVAEAVGIATAPAVMVTDASASANHTWLGPVVVKPVAAGSSHGVSLVSDPTELTDAIKQALEVDSRVLIESYVAGREIDIAIVDWGNGPEATPALEVLRNGIFDLETKYDGSAQFALPAEIAKDDREALIESACAIYRALGCSGLARVDFFLTRNGWVFNEINTIPGMTPQSQAPRMFAALGVPYIELVDRLVRRALDRDD